MCVVVLGTKSNLEARLTIDAMFFCTFNTSGNLCGSFCIELFLSIIIIRLTNEASSYFLALLLVYAVTVSMHSVYSLIIFLI